MKICYYWCIILLRNFYNPVKIYDVVYTFFYIFWNRRILNETYEPPIVTNQLGYETNFVEKIVRFFSSSQTFFSKCRVNVFIDFICKSHYTAEISGSRCWNRSHDKFFSFFLLQVNTEIVLTEMNATGLKPRCGDQPVMKNIWMLQVQI